MLKQILSSTSSSSVSARRNSSLIVSKDLCRHLVFGSNTDVGKTVVTTGLVRASPGPVVHYIKPLQSGGSDQVFVEAHVPSPRVDGVHVKAETLFSWNTPASPHMASVLEQLPVSDEEVLTSLHTALAKIQGASNTWVETAGGVLSPSSASPLNVHPKHARTKTTSSNWGWTTQGDLYQPLGLPVVLVGDGKLGGISSTLSSLESLVMRGYHVAGLVMVEQGGYDNASALRDYVSRPMKVRSGSGKVVLGNPEISILSLPELPPTSEPLHEWYKSTSQAFVNFQQYLQQSWEEQVTEYESMRTDGRNVLWWPFTQHGNVRDDSKVTLIDSAHGDNFHVIKDRDVNGDSDNTMVREYQMDACASWWTQGVGHGDSSIALASAAAAGRYGHVIFPDNVHAPAVELSKKLVNGPGKGWASRVFFSDDGSTAMEVGIKMGMKTYQKWHNVQNEAAYDWIVAAQEDCYHGDTLGVMDVAEPSVFNHGQHPWYEPKGLFLATPTLGFHCGKLGVIQPKSGEVLPLESVGVAMNVGARLDSALYRTYYESIEQEWDACEGPPVGSSKPRKIGSVVIEPIFLGAGGMKFVDPLWQRALIDVARSKKVPIVFDEVASGLYRVGVQSCREILKANPDIASYAKLLTGGLIPMSVTLASEDVFSTFLGNEKGQALLHGHSYTAHPMGCVSAIHALETYEEVLGGDVMHQSFDIEKVQSLSKLPLVQQSFALGTVMAVTIQPEKGEGSGYAAASRTTPMVQHLRDNGVYARPLGNVIYVMASPLTSKGECARLVGVLEDTILLFSKT